MTDTTDKQADFQRSTSATARALACDADLSIELQDATSAAHLGLNPPLNHGLKASSEKTIQRGLSDAIAMIAAHHDTAVHFRFEPAGKSAALLFNEMELIRCEAPGARKFTGVDHNIALLWSDSLWYSSGHTGVAELQIVISVLTREALRLTVPPDARLQSIITSWRDSTIAKSPLWSTLAPAIYDQTAYAELSLQIIDSIDASAFNSVDAEDLSIEPGNSDEDATKQDSSELPDDTNHETEESSEEPDTDQTLTVELREEEQQTTETLLAPAEESDSDDSDLANRDAPVSADAENGSQADGSEDTGYAVYSKANDEIVTARTLCTADELDQLRTALDEQLSRHGKVVGRLSGRLQRVLMSQQQRHWKFDQEEGVLDTTRLTRVVTEPLSALSFKAESDIEFKNTTVTLLVDNSKSMLGKPIAIAAACADLLSQTLERCGVAVEILGFTTTQLHGGELYDQWQHGGAAKNPGRLNGLRHIIYKSADTPYRRARKNFGVMLHKELLKQNIDGEALLWAHGRLLQRPEQRKILMVISDGAPIDTSTMGANKKNFLVDHLHQVIAGIEKRNAVELVAIGIGHDVTQYYQRAMKIMDAKDLSKSMLVHLSKLFTDSR